MSDRLTPCPDALDWTRASLDGPSPAALQHLERCPACASAWQETQQLRQLAQHLPWDEPDAERLAALETSLLDAATDAPQPRDEPSPRPRRRVLAVALALAAAALLGTSALWWIGSEDATEGVGEQPGRPAVAAVRYELLPREGTRFLAAGEPEDRVVRLIDGALTVHVEHLQAEQRFRVVAEDAEVEVVGTIFDVEVEQDRLRAVWVTQGIVELHRRQEPTLVLRAGERWERSDVPEPVPLQGDGAPPPFATLRAALTRLQPLALGLRATLSAALDASWQAASNPPPPVTTARALDASDGRGSSRDPAPATTLAKSVPEPSLPAPKAVEPSPAERAFEEGWLALEGGGNDAAAEAFARCADSPGLGEDCSYWGAVALERSGHTTQARRAWEHFVARFPASSRAPAVWVALGWKLLDEGRHDEARSAFERGLESDRPELQQSAREGLSRLR